MFLGLTKKELEQLLTAEPVSYGALFGTIKPSDRENMPVQCVAFKINSVSSVNSVSSEDLWLPWETSNDKNDKFGLSIPDGHWAWVPTENLVGKNEYNLPGGMGMIAGQEMLFKRFEGKPYIMYKTYDGWVYLGKFDRDFAPPFNGKPFIVRDADGSTLWTINQKDINHNMDYEVEEIQKDLTYYLFNGYGVKVATDAKILPAGKTLPSPWEIFTHDDMVALIGRWESDRLPKPKDLRFANLWIIKHPEFTPELPLKVGQSFSHYPLTAFQGVATLSKIFKIKEQVKLLVPKEEDDED